MNGYLKPHLFLWYGRWVATYERTYAVGTFEQVVAACKAKHEEDKRRLAAELKRLEEAE